MFKGSYRYGVLRTTKHELFICKFERYKSFPFPFTSPKSVSTDFYICYLGAGLQMNVFFFLLN